jgi:hypothetical protein
VARDATDRTSQGLVFRPNSADKGPREDPTDVAQLTALCSGPGHLLVLYVSVVLTQITDPDDV